jgi:hypothetical protein
MRSFFWRKCGYAVGISIVLAVLSGCGNQRTSTPVGYHYDVKGQQGSWQNGYGSAFTATAGNNSVTVEDATLTVNGKNYGTLQSGDKISVDVEGKVEVNGAARSPQHPPK